MLPKMFNNKYFNLNKEILFLFSLYITLLISFFYGENSTGGAILDYNNQKVITTKFVLTFKETLLNYDNFSTRHSPVLLIILSFLEKLFLSDLLIRIIHLHFCLFLPFFFYKILKIKFFDIDKTILLLITGLIFLSPTFRSLAIWPDSRILGLTFFTLSVLFFLKFKIEYKFNYAIINIISCAISAYISPNFAVFSLFFLYGYIKTYKFISKKIFIACFINFVMSIPAIYYIFVLDINFLNKTAATNFNDSDKIFFNNIFNDILITFSLIFFYLLPFLIEKVVKYLKIFKISNLLFSITIFLLCVNFFDYNYSYSGGGIFFKVSNFLFNNNYLFYIIGFISILTFLPYLKNNKENLLIFILILINNPQYTIYHKYFDPFLLIMFFSLFNFEISLKEKKIKNFYLIYFYFLTFLIVSNLKYLWTT